MSNQKWLLFFFALNLSILGLKIFYYCNLLFKTFTKYSFSLSRFSIKYLSFEDSITACKKCASSDDLYGMELCPKCNTNYKGIEYSTCIECLPQEQQIKAKEKIEFGKQMQEAHKKLGID